MSAAAVHSAIRCAVDRRDENAVCLEQLDSVHGMPDKKQAAVRLALPRSAQAAVKLWCNLMAPRRRMRWSTRAARSGRRCGSW